MMAANYPQTERGDQILLQHEYLAILTSSAEPLYEPHTDSISFRLLPLTLNVSVQIFLFCV